MKTSLENIEKTASTDYTILKLIKERWSPRVFADTPISQQDIHVLLEAGRWAPSSYNVQPWRIIWGIKGSDPYDRIYNCLDDFNQGWAKNAPLLMVTAYKTTNPEGDKNFHALHDLGQFIAMLTIQAQSMGIAVHQMAGIKADKAKKEFKFPDEYHIATGIALGYYGGDPSVLPEDLETQEEDDDRNRKPQEEIAFNGNFVERAKLEN